ncbi:MAG: hypothetical protein SFT91_04875 [Rickettsiaceae bacterium]|nr:hypothetical protein [Rickettsiaceae bacterium]
MENENNISKTEKELLDDRRKSAAEMCQDLTKTLETASESLSTLNNSIRVMLYFLLDVFQAEPTDPRCIKTFSFLKEITDKIDSIADHTKRVAELEFLTKNFATSEGRITIAIKSCRDLAKAYTKFTDYAEAKKIEFESLHTEISESITQSEFLNGAVKVIFRDVNYEGCLPKEGEVNQQEGAEDQDPEIGFIDPELAAAHAELLGMLD